MHIASQTTPNVDHAMTWFQDGSPCKYFRGLTADRLLSVGWLSSSKPFSEGVIAPTDRDALEILHDQPLPRGCYLRLVSVFCGYHICELCDDGTPGFHNVFVPDLALMRVWVFPGLMLHYIDAHRYRPPRRFITAMRACPKIGSRLYFEQLQLCFGWEVDDTLGMTIGRVD